LKRSCEFGEECPLGVIMAHELHRDYVWQSDRNFGFSSVKAIIGNKIFPGLLDRFLARHGYDAQQTDEPADRNRPDNLWMPLPKDFDAHGRFNDRACSWSMQLLATTHRGWLASAGVAIAVGGACLVYKMVRWNSMRSLSDLDRTA
jgi:hypothetical protein